MFPFYTPWEHQKTFGFQVILGFIIWNTEQKWVNKVTFHIRLTEMSIVHIFIWN